MPCKVLVKAQTHGPFTKGFPVLVVDDGHEFGVMEGLPDFVVLRITDATKDQIDHFIQSWRTNFTHEVVVENDQGYRIKISVDPKVVTVFGADRGVKQDIIDILVNGYGANVVDVSLANYFVTVDIPKPVDLQLLKNHILDIFEQELDVRVHYFLDGDVDLAVAAGGQIELTKAQALAKVKNRLTD